MAEPYKREDYELIADLFFRAGIWVSYCDDTDQGEKSEILETKQMQLAFRRVEKIAINEIISKAAHMAQLGRPVPGAETETTLSDDIKRAVFILKSREDLPALTEFRRAMMYISTMVARAYREESDHHEDEFLMQSFMDKITAHLNKISDPKEFKNLNVSPAEDSALTLISEALRVKV